MICMPEEPGCGQGEAVMTFYSKGKLDPIFFLLRISDFRFPFNSKPKIANF
jgi:hypothetical protein